MRYMSVCSGVEAASLAWEYLDWEPVAFADVEPFPCAVLKSHWPKVPNLGDLTKIHILENGDIQYGTTSIIPNDGKPIDILIGGTPCTSFSSAGKREGLRGVSGLALDYVRLLYELAAYRGLRYAVHENVPGMLSTGTPKGSDYATFLSALTGWDVDTPRNGWGSAGVIPPASEGNFGVAYRILDVRYCRVDGFPKAIPQRRRRVFTLLCLGDWKRPAEILFEQQSLLGNHPPQRSSRQGVSSSSSGGSRGDDRPDGEAGGVDGDDAEGRCRGSGGHAPGEGSRDVPRCDGESERGGNGRPPVAFEPGIARREGDPNRFVDGVSPTLRAVMGDNLPAVAQENKVELLLNDLGDSVPPHTHHTHHGRCVKAFRESSFGGYAETEESAVQKASGGALGGGSETFAVMETDP